jgi:hypothetical protein
MPDNFSIGKNSFIAAPKIKQADKIICAIQSVIVIDFERS